nr:ABC transporter permease [uncultured Cohaesibacter sp.]
MRISNQPFSVYFRYALLPVIVIIFSVMSSGFLSVGNLFAIGQNFAVITPVALAIGLTMIAGELDLSAGALVALAGLVMVKTGVDYPLLGLLATIGLGVLVGAFNAYLTQRLQVSSLVITLGVMIIVQGAAVWLEGGQNAAFDHWDLIDFVGMTVLGIFSPWSIIALLLGGISMVMLGYTRLGRDIYAAGSDRKAAFMSGTKVSRALFAVFICSGVFSSLNGALMAVSLGRASSQFGGSLLIQSVTAAILGGVALSGGVGKISGILLGALILSVLSNGLSFIGADSSTILLVNGGVLLLVVLIESGISLKTGILFGAFSQSQTNK